MLQRVTREKIPPRRRATYDDLLQAPDHLVAELIGGELFTSPRPKLPHALAASALGGLLLPRFHLRSGSPGGWLLLDEPQVHLGDDVLVPDLAGWRRTRRPEMGDGYCTIAPDWVCEILSPSTRRLDRHKKLRVYAREQIPYAWFVEPVERAVEVMRLEGTRWLVEAVYSQHDRMRASPFDAVVIPLSELWDEIPPHG